MYKKIIIIMALMIAGLLVFGPVNTAVAKRGGGGGQLTPIEKEGLTYMREEEKLARDVYLYLYSLYGLNNFSNISQAEQNHMDALLNLLNYYGLPDPASNQMGVFTNPQLQALYDDLIAWGSQSLNDAIRVGGTIEEVDIRDLEYYLTQTTKSNIQQVYGSLMCGSENHLRAFVSSLYNLFGEEYSPLYLSLERYLGIIEGSTGGCGSGGGGWGGGH